MLWYIFFFCQNYNDDGCWQYWCLHIKDEMDNNESLTFHNFHKIDFTVCTKVYNVIMVAELELYMNTNKVLLLQVTFQFSVNNF